MSANMCDEVVGLIEDTGISKLEISVAFSPEWGSESGEPSHAFRVERRYMDLLKEASSRLRRAELPREETVIGRIVRLETDGNPSDIFNDKAGREIVLSWDSGEYGHIRVQVALDPAGYLTALEAHSKGQLFAVTGLLKRAGRSWTLEQLSNARLIG